jgi:hypothetical protein
LKIGEKNANFEMFAAAGAAKNAACCAGPLVRERGNSAQQMKDHGRNPSRESAVLFRKKG